MGELILVIGCLSASYYMIKIIAGILSMGDDW